MGGGEGLLKERKKTQRKKKKKKPSKIGVSRLKKEKWL